MTFELTTDILTYIVAGLIILIVFLIINLVKTNKRVDSLLRTKHSGSLEDSIKRNVADLEQSLRNQSAIESAIKRIQTDLDRTISGVGVIRFNPFEGSSGSNQSFAVALINEHGDGVIFSSLYSREKVSVFAKPIEKFHSTYKLTEEETKALGKARGV